jgi:hypothetical protein
MFKAPRRVAPLATSRAPVIDPPATDPVAASYDTGVRQTLDEHRGFGWFAGFLLLAIGGTLIASANHAENAHRCPATWTCTPATEDDGCAGPTAVTMLAADSGDRCDAEVAEVATPDANDEDAVQDASLPRTE